MEKGINQENGKIFQNNNDILFFAISVLFYTLLLKCRFAKMEIKGGVYNESDCCIVSV